MSFTFKFCFFLTHSVFYFKSLSKKHRKTNFSYAGMAADKTQQLYVGDAILSVNNHSLKASTHEEAVQVLKAASNTTTLEGGLWLEVVVVCGWRWIERWE